MYNSTYNLPRLGSSRYVCRGCTGSGAGLPLLRPFGASLLLRLACGAGFVLLSSIGPSRACRLGGWDGVTAPYSRNDRKTEEYCIGLISFKPFYFTLLYIQSPSLKGHSLERTPYLQKTRIMSPIKLKNASSAPSQPRTSPL